MEAYDQTEWLDNFLAPDPNNSLYRLIWMDEMIGRSILEEMYKQELEASIETYSEKELNELASYLKNNMPCPIDHGLNYNQTAIRKKLNEHCKPKK